MGYVEETGSAQHYRDVRITTIYEGTTGIQGLDLVGRKILADNGATLQGLLDEIQATAEAMSDIEELAGQASALKNAVASGKEARTWLLEHAGQNRNVAGGVSVNFMMLLGYVCGGWMMGQSALKAAHLLGDGGSNESFLRAKLATAQFYTDHLLPRAGSCLATVKAGANSIMALDVEQF